MESYQLARQFRVRQASGFLADGAVRRFEPPAGFEQKGRNFALTLAATYTLAEKDAMVSRATG